MGSIKRDRIDLHNIIVKTQIDLFSCKKEIELICIISCKNSNYLFSCEGLFSWASLTYAYKIN